MNAALDHTRPPPPRRRPRLLIELTLGLLPLAVTAAATAWMFALPTGYLVRSVAVYGLLALLLHRHLPRHLAGLGAANLVTLVRAGIVLAIATSVPQREVASAAGAWWTIGLASVALVLDGVDGRVARRTGTSTAFGARFDMELDSFLMLVLALVVWQSGRLGPWVLLLGLPRYLFVAAGWRWRWLRAPLPERRRRKAGCVLQGIALLVSLGPVVPGPLAAAVAATALTLLTSSFLVDVAWLWRRRPTRSDIIQRSHD